MNTSKQNTCSRCQLPITWTRSYRNKWLPLDINGGTHFTTCKAKTRPYTGPLTEASGHTAGEGPDVGYVYCGEIAPWAGELHDYRPFTHQEMQAREVCFRLPN